jgi:hypothetical protein
MCAVRVQSKWGCSKSAAGVLILGRSACTTTNWEALCGLILARSPLFRALMAFNADGVVKCAEVLLILKVRGIWVPGLSAGRSGLHDAVHDATCESALHCMPSSAGCDRHSRSSHIASDGASRKVLALTRSDTTIGLEDVFSKQKVLCICMC